MKKKKKALSLAAIASLTMLLAACSNKPVTSHSTGFWDHYIVYNFSQFIIWLSNHTGGYGMGIIIVIATDVLPNEVNDADARIDPAIKGNSKEVLITGPRFHDEDAGRNPEDLQGSWRSPNGFHVATDHPVANHVGPVPSYLADS